MAPRAQVDRIQRTEQLRPAAEQVDTYVRPARSPLLDVADALGQFDSGLKSFIDQRDKKAEEDADIKGRARAFSDTDGEFATLVDSGKIPAQYSPFYVKGFQKGRGERMASSLKADWQDYWDKSTWKDSEDPDAFDKGFQQWAKSKVPADASPDLLRGLMPGLEAIQSGANDQFTEYRHNKLVGDNLATGAANGLDTVTEGLNAGSALPEGADYPKIFSGVNEKFAATVANGDPGQKAEGVFIDAMSAKIIASGDADLLKWFDTKVPGKDYTWRQTVKGIETANQTEASLASSANSQQVRLDKEDTERRKMLKDQAETGLIDALIKDPRAPFDPKLVEQAQKNGNPRILVDMTSWRDSVLKGIPSNPADIQGFYSKIISGEQEPNAALKDALAHGIFTKPEDMTAASNFVQSFKTHQAVIEKTMDSSQYKSYMEAIRVRTIGKDVTLNPIAGVSNEGFEAQSDFRQLAARFLIDHPNATPQEIQNELDRIGKQTLDRITQPDDPTAVGEYERPADMTFPSTFDPSKGGQQQEDPDKDVHDWEKANQVGPEDKKAFEDQAVKNGMSYEEYVRKQMGGKAKGATAPDGTPIDKMSYTPGEERDTDLGEGDETIPVTKEQAEGWIDEAFGAAGASSTSELDHSSQTGAMLGLIRHAEAGGSYNAVFGNPHNKKDLGQFTLDDILGFQRDARKRGAKSTAIGGYQFIYKTLRGLKQSEGLTGSEKFTPELQDQLGVALLNRRGLQAYRAGKISKATFALSLSQEWAGLPNPNTGRSFYDGDGLNASQVKTSKVYAALGMPVTEVSYQPQAATEFSAATPARDPYANIPDSDESGNAGQREKFRQWNPDPVGNNELNLAEIDPSLANVYRKAQASLPFQIVVGQGKRTTEQQSKARKWGWSKTDKSDHLTGSAADIWAIDENGAVTFDSAKQTQVVLAMKQAAKELGVELDAGADWKKFKDAPHFAVKGIKT
jgi:muramidase (phage lysozyme)